MAPSASSTLIAAEASNAATRRTGSGAHQHAAHRLVRQPLDLGRRRDLDEERGVGGTGIVHRNDAEAAHLELAADAFRRLCAQPSAARTMRTQSSATRRAGSG